MRARSFGIVSLALLVPCFVECAGMSQGRTALPDGSYKLSCEKPLADCLQLASVCSQHGYYVISAREETERNGVEPVNSIITQSEAIIRCRQASTVFGGSSSSARPTATAAPAGARCFPGATQACLGPGACRGAQTCLSDGARFGPCDCGGAPPPAAMPLEGGDAGPPPTWAVPPDGAAPP